MGGGGGCGGRARALTGALQDTASLQAHTPTLAHAQQTCARPACTAATRTSCTRRARCITPAAWLEACAASATSTSSSGRWGGDKEGRGRGGMSRARTHWEGREEQCGLNVRGICTIHLSRASLTSSSPFSAASTDWSAPAPQDTEGMLQGGNVRKRGEWRQQSPYILCVWGEGTAAGAQRRRAHTKNKRTREHAQATCVGGDGATVRISHELSRLCTPSTGAT